MPQHHFAPLAVPDQGLRAACGRSLVSPAAIRHNPHVSVTLLTLAPLAALLHVEKEDVTGPSSALWSPADDSHTHLSLSLSLPREHWPIFRSMGLLHTASLILEQSAHLPLYGSWETTYQRDSLLCSPVQCGSWTPFSFSKGIGFLEPASQHVRVEGSGNHVSHSSAHLGSCGYIQ